MNLCKRIRGLPSRLDYDCRRGGSFCGINNETCVHNLLIYLPIYKQFDTDTHLWDSVPGMRGEDKATDPLPMSAARRKRQILESGGGARKKVASSPNREKPYSLRSFLKPMGRGTEADISPEFDSGDEVATQLVEVKCSEKTGTLVLDDTADEYDPACPKRKRSIRLRVQNQVNPTKEQSIKANMGSCSKRRRADELNNTGQADREPSVILAWKHWCMYEDDGEEVDVLVNKRDERRRLERQNELPRQVHTLDDAADSIKIEALDNVMSSNNDAVIAAGRAREVKDVTQTSSELPLVTESGASHVDKREAVPGDLRSLTGSEDRPVQTRSGEGPEGSNTPAGIDSKLRMSPGRKGTSDSDIEIASRSFPTSVNLDVSDRHVGNTRIHSRAGSTQALTIGDQTDPSFFSAQEDSMVLDTIAEGVTTNSVAERTSHESISQSTLNDICMKPKAHGVDKKKGIHQSGTSHCGRYADDVVVDLDEQEDGTDGVEPVVKQLGVGDSAGFRVPDSVPESSNQPRGSYPTVQYRDTSEQDWGQSSGSAVPVVAIFLDHEVFEEQGESIGELNELAHRRGKQKVIELSDEEEDSNRVSIERRVFSGQHSYHGLEGRARSNGDGGATTSGAEISSVDVAGRFAGAGRQFPLPEHPRLVDYDDIDGGTVESNAPFQASVGLNADFEGQAKTYYRRRGRNQGKAIAGEDSGEEVRRPTTRRDGESSDVDSHEGQLGGEVRREASLYCPVCYEELEPDISNEGINDHIDKCLSRF
ncbi:uncharacterized protein [Physcomitrium patens]|uniref:Uncharacterized protein n=2 Tax=Physcomitrium patens TaxID=3218 RepID=A0A2K1IXR4_PHYPA|nr:uncharacterized protein LOC112272631 isoform X1 [Physcomitrium patens]XP_024356350.1 uncharacterized protein LOC112272631 isoform X1 [Physcomitrium patens]PNR34056.1 hypothetical protein PHYPA_023872 [Physcomitrium patens]|eukprot:XP_024356349.1 uncharacterized protein LOC112272631 isoform X1 [Physcomitrella patens]